MLDFDRKMPVYPIRTVVRLTGVNPRTLRGWERQNGLLSPARTEGGHRLFSEEDVERIRQIKGLLDRGMSLKGIQQLAVFPTWKAENSPEPVQTRSLTTRNTSQPSQRAAGPAKEALRGRSR